MFKPNLSNLLHTVTEAGKTIWDTHGTKIMFYGGLACTGVATILAADGAIKANDVLAKKKAESEEELTMKEQIKTVAPHYIPAFALWTVGAAAQIGGFKTEVTNGVSALAAYKMAEMAKEELEKSTKNVIGEKKVQKIREDIVQQHRVSHPVTQSKIVLTGNGDQLFYEPYSNQYFKSSIDSVRKAVDEINNYIYSSPEDMATINNFYNALRIPNNLAWGDDFIFSSNNPLKLEFEYTGDDAGNPVAELWFVNSPMYER